MMSSAESVNVCFFFLFFFLFMEALCKAGSYSPTGMKPCLPCDKGYYQDMEGQASCFKCGPNQTTSAEGSNSSMQCGGIHKSLHKSLHTSNVAGPTLGCPIFNNYLPQAWCYSTIITDPEANNCFSIISEVIIKNCKILRETQRKTR